MYQYQPDSNLVHLTEQEIQPLFSNNQDILNCNTETDQGFYFQVDLRYSSDIHQEEADFPLPPEAAQLTQGTLSPCMEYLYQQIMSDRNSNHATPAKFTSSYKLLHT